MPSQDFSDRLRETMEAQGVSVPRLSYETNIPERTIFRYRAGVTEPRDAHGAPTRNAYALAECLSVDIGWLLERPQELAS